MWISDLDCKGSWVPKNWCFWTVVLEKTLESPLDSKEIKLVNPKGNQPWIFIGRTDGEAEAPILWPFDAKNWLIKKDPDAGKDWRQEEKGMTEVERVGWDYQLDGHEFEQAPGAGVGQGSLACCSPWGCKYLDTASDWTELSFCPYSFPASGVFSELALCIKWPNYWSFSFCISPSNEYSGLISFRID